MTYDDKLPDGQPFPFWDDGTPYTKTYHVAQEHPGATDDNPGTAEQPFATIGRAASILEPGEKVCVHQGLYRECVQPPRGGVAADKMIAYEAAPGETVTVTGAEPWEPDARPSTGWRLPQAESGATVWMADLPADRFEDGYNPFLIRNAYEYVDTYAPTDDKDFVRRAMMRRGAVTCDGVRLKQVYRCSELAKSDGAFWVEDPGLRLHFRLPCDVDPAGARLEFTAREQVFAPREHGLGYIRVSGFHFTHAADGLPVPQRACVSTSRGHHWIVEDCRIEWANAIGLDIGAQHWSATAPSPSGHHVIRRNTIRNCGICGIAGARGIVSTLIEGNTIEHIGGLDLERMWECAGIKFHFCCNSVIRRNVFRHLTHAAGVWLDVDNVNNRITNNVFVDIVTLLGAIFSEMNYEVNVVDRNVIWDIRRPEGTPASNTDAGSGLHCDCNEKLVCAHNVFGKIEGDAIVFGLGQSDRKSSGRTGLCRANSALNNVFHRCPHRVHLGRLAENRCDGNVYDAAHDPCSFRIRYPEPECYQDLARWQEYFEQDRQSVQVPIEADFDPETLALTWRVDGELPECEPVAHVSGAQQPSIPGPFDPAAWAKSTTGEWATQTFPAPRSSE